MIAEQPRFHAKGLRSHFYSAFLATSPLSLVFLSNVHSPWFLPGGLRMDWRQKITCSETSDHVPRFWCWQSPGTEDQWVCLETKDDLPCGCELTALRTTGTTRTRPPLSSASRSILFIHRKKKAVLSVVSRESCHQRGWLYSIFFCFQKNSFVLLSLSLIYLLSIVVFLLYRPAEGGGLRCHSLYGKAKLQEQELRLIALTMWFIRDICSASGLGGRNRKHWKSASDEKTLLPEKKIREVTKEPRRTTLRS